MTPNQIRQVWQRARCLYSEDEVEAALDRMAGAIRAELADRDPILMCIMHGGVIVTGKLAVRLNFPLQMDYLHATRYRGETRGTDLQWRAPPTLPLEGRTILLIDDIFDEGETLALVRDYCLQQGGREVFAAVLIDKQHDRKVAGMAVDFVGLTAEDSYLFGYGMDYRGYLRNAPGIYAIHDDDL
ncbi:MAG: hypoxanthine-guanine phosphoribosyltransferase [Gammaproteobacteria bacterium]|nr:hypoxanthine-guanine phosphoribosyltransferase [Gammaproteobacteria bacterium]